ncbi:hypothetical protein [Streptococcus penaeicida]|nr:hypothetical protein [Streptococcus penaeicida]
MYKRKKQNINFLKSLEGLNSKLFKNISICVILSALWGIYQHIDDKGIIADLTGSIKIQKILAKEIENSYSANPYHITVKSDKVDWLSNYFENNIYINNTMSSDVEYNKISLLNVVVNTNYKYSDIRLNSGINSKKQHYIGYVFNNGTKTSNSRYLVSYFINENNKKKKIFTKEYSSNMLDRGSVEKLFDINLREETILKNFNDLKDNNTSGLEINIKNLKTKQSESAYLVFQNGKFSENIGATAPPMPPNDLTIFELTKPYSKIYTNNIMDTIQSGKSKYKFNILVDKPCILTYKLEMKNGNKKQTLTKWSKIKIRMPVYKDQTFGIHGKIFFFAEKFNLAKFNITEVKYLDPTLLYDINTTKKDYNLR